ncbi:putative methyltransferase-domain-containing protein [Mycena albidolilacea]|uniref:Methyltransferase-domain-containing protein n=1 Tax=Mycena albidolilacea TaxID=1033008 RepID=A0AAD7F3Q9_9AGAR|nr:putative methyltransferase-domain-containing protein [Mycena albidolilacea]
MNVNPNFPQNLDIRPSVPIEEGVDETFDFDHQQEAIRVFGIAGKVWKAAYALNSYINPPADQIFDPPLFPHPEARKNARMLELGSGTGIVAATMAAMLHANDILFVTDLPEVCPLLEQNLQGSLDGPTRVRPLSWGNSQHALSIADELSKLQDTPYLTHILCSDLVYFPELLAPLLRSLIQLSSPPFISPPNQVEVIISYKVRSLAKETPFWSAFGLWFEFAPVLVKMSPSGSWQRFGVSLEDPTFVFVARRREESFDWQVPPSDADLMQGIMAQGTPLPKGDDTFETLLLMSLNVSDEI